MRKREKRIRFIGVKIVWLGFEERVSLGGDVGGVKVGVTLLLLEGRMGWLLLMRVSFGCVGISRVGMGFLALVWIGVHFD